MVMKMRMRMRMKLNGAWALIKIFVYFFWVQFLSKYVSKSENGRKTQIEFTQYYVLSDEEVLYFIFERRQLIE